MWLYFSSGTSWAVVKICLDPSVCAWRFVCALACSMCVMKKLLCVKTDQIGDPVNIINNFSQKRYHRLVVVYIIFIAILILNLFLISDPKKMDRRCLADQLTTLPSTRHTFFTAADSNSRPPSADLMFFPCCCCCCCKQQWFKTISSAIRQWYSPTIDRKIRSNIGQVSLIDAFFCLCNL